MLWNIDCENNVAVFPTMLFRPNLMWLFFVISAMFCPLEFPPAYVPLKKPPLIFHLRYCNLQAGPYTVSESHVV